MVGNYSIFRIYIVKYRYFYAEETPVSTTFFLLNTTQVMFVVGYFLPLDNIDITLVKLPNNVGGIQPRATAVVKWFQSFQRISTKSNLTQVKLDILPQAFIQKLVTHQYTDFKSSWHILNELKQTKCFQRETKEDYVQAGKQKCYRNICCNYQPTLYFNDLALNQGEA